MENKILIKLILPEFDINFDVFIPVNEVVWKVKRMLLKCSCDLSNVKIDLKREYLIINKDTCNVYGNNDIIIDTDIRNGSELIMIKKINK